MDVKLETKPIAEVEADALVVLGFEGAAPGGSTAQLSKELYDSGEFTGKALEISILHHPAGLKSKRLVLAGAGKPDKFSPAELRKVAGAALRSLKCKGIRTICYALDEAYRSDEFTSAVVEGAILGDFEPDQYKTDPKKNEKRVDWFSVLGGSQAALDRGRILGESQNFTRTLINEPANVLTPLNLAERARAMAAEAGLDFEVLDQDRMRQLGM